MKKFNRHKSFFEIAVNAYGYLDDKLSFLT